jgi:hypothetical protein
LHRLIPERLLPERIEESLVASPYGTGKDVKATVFPTNAREEFFDLCGIGVIDLHCDATTAAARDFVRGVLNGPSRCVGGFGPGARGAASDVDRSAGVAEREGDAATAATTGAGNDCDFTVQRVRHRFEDILYGLQGQTLCTLRNSRNR